MARFRFPFENIIKIRKTEEEVAQRDLQEALALLNQEKDFLAGLEEQHHQAFATRHQIEIQGGTAAGPLTQVHEFLAGQDIRIDRQKKKIVEVEKKVEELREILRLKAIDTKIVKELKARKKRDFDEIVRKKENAAVDDMNLMRQRLKRGSGG